MKINIRIAYLFLIGLCLGCSDDNEEPAKEEDVNKTFTVDVDGQTTSFSENLITDYSSNNYHEYMLNAVLYNETKLVVRALDRMTDQSVILAIGDAFRGEKIEEGTYFIGNPDGDYPIGNIYYDNEDVFGDNNNYFFNKNYGCHLTGGDVVGEVVISELDKENKRVKGSFNGNLAGWVNASSSPEEYLDYVASSVTLSNGNFDLPYTEENSFEKDSDIDKGVFSARITHEDRDFMFLPTDGVVTGVGTRHFVVQLTMNDDDELRKIDISVENENLGILNILFSSDLDIKQGEAYYFETDMYVNHSELKKYIEFFDFFYDTAYFNSPLPYEKNDSYIKILSLNREDRIIEGEFETSNSERNTTISEGYFKVKYVEK